LTGIRHLFDLNDPENDGLDAILSARALNVLNLMASASEALLVHEGIRPHLRS